MSNNFRDDGQQKVIEPRRGVICVYVAYVNYSDKVYRYEFESSDKSLNRVLHINGSLRFARTEVHGETDG